MVVSFNTPTSLERCLSSLAGQARTHDAEILVVRAAGLADAECQRIRERFPSCRWLTGPAQETIPGLRSLGLAAARADVVALLEDDCVTRDNWCDAVLQAHEGPWIAVGGAVEPGAYRRLRDWAIYFCEYARFMLPFDAAESADLPGNNVAYKRTALQASGVLDTREFYDVFAHKEWQRQGFRLLRTPTIVVENRNLWPLSYLTAGPFHHGRGFAATRMAGQRWWKRGLLASLAPFLPLLQLCRIARVTIGRRRQVGRVVLAVPGILVFVTSWAAGECLGYVLGPGSSMQRWR